MRNKKSNVKYFNQDYVITQINSRTEIPSDDIRVVLNTLGDVIKDNVSDEEIIIKIFPGLKVTSKYISQGDFSSNLNLGENKCNNTLKIKGVFSNYYKKDIKKKFANILH